MLSNAEAALDPLLKMPGRSVAYESKDSIRIPVSLDRKALEEASVTLRTLNSTAHYPGDYTYTEVTLTWSAGEHGRQFMTVPIHQDKINEKIETILIEVVESSGLRVPNVPRRIAIYNAEVPEFPEELNIADNGTEERLDEVDNSVDSESSENAETETETALDGSEENTDAASASEIIIEGTQANTDEFRVFNSMLYRNMPQGFGEKLAVAYEQTFYSGTQQNIDGTPSDAGIANAARSIASQAGAPHFATADLSVMDIERWPVWPFVTDDEHVTSLKRYASALGRFGDAVGENVCIYAIASQAGINHANFALDNPTIRAEWTKHSNMTRDILVPEADALCPSLYVYYSDIGDGVEIDRWRNFAIETIKEARRIAPNKPVYPFIWPQFHGGGSVRGYPYIPEKYWRVVLETIRDHADGAILWGGYDIDNGRQLQWNGNANWVKLTREVFDL